MAFIPGTDTSNERQPSFCTWWWTMPPPTYEELPSTLYGMPVIQKERESFSKRAKRETIKRLLKEAVARALRKQGERWLA